VVSVDYKENSTEIVVTTLLDKKPVTKVITYKATKTIIIEV
jgi:hypothetical protein